MNKETLKKGLELSNQIELLEGDIESLKEVIDHGISSTNDYQIGITDNSGLIGVGIAREELLIIAPILLKAAYEKHAKLKKQFAEL